VEAYPTGLEAATKDVPILAGLRFGPSWWFGPMAL